MDDDRAMNKCRLIGLHPLNHPLGDSHHCDVPFSKEDEDIGNALAYFLGTLFSDVDDDRAYWHSKRTSIDEWRRVARALRIHGLSITDKAIVPSDAPQPNALPRPEHAFVGGIDRWCKVCCRPESNPIHVLHLPEE